MYVVGLAADYCVKATAADAAREGFKTYIVEEGTRPVEETQWMEIQGELKAKGIGIVKFEGEEVGRVRKVKAGQQMDFQ